MYVCICNGITDRQIREAAQAGCTTVTEMTMRTGAGSCCGSCVELVGEIIEDVHPRTPALLQIHAQAA